MERFHRLYASAGFPPPEAVRVVKRECTAGGRYVDLECDAYVALKDGPADLQGSFIELPGLPNGMMAVVWIKGRKLRTLELTVYGGDPWDGSERGWRIV